MEKSSTVTFNATTITGISSSPNSFAWTLYVSIGAVWIPGSICNLIALKCIIGDIRQSVSPANFLLLILVCCNLTAVIFSTIHHIFLFFIPTMTKPLCIFLLSNFTFSRVSSAVINLIMAVDRYLAISRPFYYKRYVTARTWKVVCVIASLSIGVYCLFPLMGLGDVRVEKLGDSLNCIWLDYVEHPPQRVFGMIYPLIGFLCILTIFLCNAIVIRELIRLGNRIVTVIPPLEGNNSAGTSGQDSSNTKVTPFEVAFAKMMASLSIVYLACGLPYHTLVLVQQFAVPVNPMIEGIVHFLAATIYIVDPIVYILIRKAKRLKKLFCGLCLREKSHGIGALSLNKRNVSEIAKAERPTEIF